MESPRTYPESIKRLALGLVGGGIAVGLVTLFSTTLWWAAAALGAINVGPVVAATVIISFVLVLPVINLLYVLQVNIHGEPELDERMDLLGELFPDLSAFLVSALYVNLLVAVVVVLSSIGTVTMLPATLLAIGYVVADIEALQRFQRSPVGIATAILVQPLSAISTMRSIPLAEFPVVRLQRAHH